MDSCARQSPSALGASDAAEYKPLPDKVHPGLFGDFSVNFFRLKLLEGNRRALGVLENFANVGQWLMQRATARRSGLHHRAGPTPARDQPFLRQFAQRFSHREPAHPVMLAQHGFRWKRIFRSEVTPQDRSAQFIGKLKITGPLDLSFVHLGVLPFRWSSQDSERLFSHVLVKARFT